MQLTKAAILIAAIAAIQALPAPCRAGVSSRPNVYKRLQLTMVRDYSRGLDVSAIQPVLSMRVTTSEDVAKMIPCDALQVGQDGGRIANQIVERSFRTLLNSDQVKQSGIGRTAASVDEIGAGGLDLGRTDPEAIQHKFKIAMKPTQTRALLTYQGLTNAQVSYRASESKLDLELREPVELFATDLVLNHVSQPGDQRDVVSLRWAW